MGRAFKALMQRPVDTRLEMGRKYELGALKAGRHRAKGTNRTYRLLPRFISDLGLRSFSKKSPPTYAACTYRYGCVIRDSPAFSSSLAFQSIRRAPTYLDTGMGAHFEGFGCCSFLSISWKFVFKATASLRDIM